MEEENSGMWMVIYMMVNEVMIKQMDKVFTTIIMALNTKEVGRMIFKMDSALKHGMMVPGMKVDIKWAKSMAKELIYGMMAQNMKDLGVITKSVDL